MEHKTAVAPNRDGRLSAFVRGLGRLKAKVAADRDPGWVYFSLQKLIRNPDARRYIGRLEARFKPKTNGHSLHPRAERWYKELEELGQTSDLQLLSEGEVRDMYDYLVKQQWHDYKRPDFGTFTVDRVPPETPIAYVPLETLVGTPHLMSLAADPRVVHLLEAYFGCKPRIEVISASWSDPRDDDAKESQQYHRDTDGMQFIKLFIHLTDVTPESGPHCFVLGSHSSSRLTKPGFFSDEEVEVVFGPDKIATMTGPRGTCYLENTFGVHKGTKPASQSRMFLQVLYTSHPTIYPPKKPLLERMDLDEKTRAECDPYVLSKFVR